MPGQVIRTEYGEFVGHSTEERRRDRHPTPDARRRAIAEVFG